tara:strand:- start:86 stop:667 length:582 start_codon:yes stop_codon:yes gene_type:complete
MDETTFLVALIDPSGYSDDGTTVSSINGAAFASTNSWSYSANAVLGSSWASLVGTPNVVDIRNMTKNRAMRYDLSAGDLIVIYETGQTVEYPTISWDVRNEVYNMTISIRTLQDERGASDANFARKRLENLYKVLRHRIEQNRKGAIVTLSDGESLKMNQLFIGNRTESNDRNKRLFGYKLTADMKKYAVSIP